MNLQWLKAFGNTSYVHFAANATEGINRRIVGKNLFLVYEQWVKGKIEQNSILGELWKYQRAFFVFSCVMLFLTFLYLVVIIPFLMRFIYSNPKLKPKRYWKKSLASLTIPTLVSACIVLLGLLICFGSSGLMDFFIEQLPKDREKFNSTVIDLENRNASEIVSYYLEKADALKQNVTVLPSSASTVHIINQIDKSVEFIKGTTFFKDITGIVSSKGLHFDDEANPESIKNANKYRSWAFFIYLVVYLVMIVILSFGAFSCRPLFSLAATFLVIMTFFLCIYAHMNYASASLISSACSGGSPSKLASIILQSNDTSFNWENFFNVCSKEGNVLDALDSIYRSDYSNIRVGSMIFYGKNIPHSKDIIRLTRDSSTGCYIEYNTKTKIFTVESAVDIKKDVEDLGNPDITKAWEEYYQGLHSHRLLELLECRTVSDSFVQIHHQLCHNGRNAFNGLNSGLYAVIIFMTIALMLAPAIVRRLRKRMLIYDPKEDLE